MVKYFNTNERIVFQLKDYIKSKQNFISVAVTLIASVGFWIFQPTDPVPASFFVIAVICAFLFLWLFLISHLSKSEAINENDDSLLITIIEVCDNVYVCYPNKLLSQDVFVSFYLQTNKFEKLVGYGIVTNVQTNGIIQITIKETCNGYSSSTLQSQDFSKIIIKPTVTVSYINQKINEKEQKA